MDKKQLVLEMLQAEGKDVIDLEKFFTTMFLEYRFYSPDTHGILLELEEEGKLVIKKVFDGYVYDNYDRKASSYNYSIILK